MPDTGGSWGWDAGLNKAVKPPVVNEAHSPDEEILTHKRK